MNTNVVELPLKTEQAEKILRDTAAESKRVIFTNHALERMLERRISRIDVIRVLSKGRISEGPSQEPKGNWKMTVEGVSAGSLITVVVVIDYKQLIEEDCYSVVITAYE